MFPEMRPRLTHLSPLPPGQMPYGKQLMSNPSPLSKDCSWDTHIAIAIGEGRSHVGKMDAILTGLHLDTRIKSCILMKVIVPKLEYAGEVWEGSAKLVEQLQTVQTTAAKKIPTCSSTTSVTVLGAELGMHPLKTDISMR